MKNFAGYIIEYNESCHIVILNRISIETLPKMENVNGKYITTVLTT